MVVEGYPFKIKLWRCHGKRGSMDNTKSRKTVMYGEMPEDALLARCAAGGIGCVVAEDMTVVSRDVPGFMKFLDRLYSYGVALRLEKEGLTLKP